MTANFPPPQSLMMIMDIALHFVIPAVLAAIIVRYIHKTTVNIALLKCIVDNPNARKLNKRPVPILGGVEVFIAITIATCLCSISTFDNTMFVIFAGSLLMLFVGVADDILDIRPKTKFVCEILAVCMVMFLCELRVDSFHGLWGIYALPKWFSYALTLFAAVGIINAINLIDGVDGLSSSFGIFSSFICGLSLIYLGEVGYATLAFAVCGALVPFFIFNVFSNRFKMYFGDSGSLTLGFIFSVFIIKIIHSQEPSDANASVSFVLAIFAIPVFDTIRVMCTRIIKGNSPFKPDKTHLHHMLIEMGFGHRLTTLSILVMSIVGVVVWGCLFVSGVDDSYILYTTIAMGLASTFGVYYLGLYIIKHKLQSYLRMSRKLCRPRIIMHRMYRSVQVIVDGKSNQFNTYK